jgi:hypothetical protein
VKLTPLALALVLTLSAAPRVLAAPPLADPATQSMRAHFDAGVHAYDAKPPDYVHALDEFRAAYRDKPSPIIKQNIALCLRALGRYVEAITTLREMLDEGGDAIKPNVRDGAAKAIAEMSDLVATVRVAIHARSTQNAPDLRPALIVDGALVPPAKMGEPLRLDPGEHRFRVHAEGYTDAAQTVTLAQGQRDLAIVLELVPIAAADPPLVAPPASAQSPLPPPIDSTPTPPASPAKRPLRHYGLIGLSLQSEQLHLTPVLDEKLGSAAHTFNGAAVIVRLGRHLDKHWDLGGLGELGVFAAESYLSPNDDRVPAKTGIVNWVLAPEIRVHGTGQLRGIASLAVGVEGTLLSATLSELDRTTMTSTLVTHTGGGVGLMALIELGGQLELGRAFVEGVFFLDVHGARGVKDGGNLIDDTSAARGGLRLLVGLRF